MKTLVMMACVVMALATTSTAEIADSAANGFTYKMSLQLNAPPDAVYQKLLSIGNWWSSSHTFSGDAHNMAIDPKPMGCWCEKLPDGGGVRHMQVVMVMPGKMLVMTGGLGPLQSMAATGSMTFKISPANGGTKLDVMYGVTGYFPAGAAQLTAPVDAVLNEQFTRFKSYVETGNAVTAGEQKK